MKTKLKADESLKLTADDLEKLASALEDEDIEDEPLNLPYSSLEPPLGIDAWK